MAGDVLADCVNMGILEVLDNAIESSQTSWIPQCVAEREWQFATRISSSIHIVAARA